SRAAAPSTTPWGTPPPRARRLPRLGKGRDGARPQARRRRTPRPVHAGWRPAPRSARRALAPSPARGGRSGWGHGRRRADGGPEAGSAAAGGPRPSPPPQAGEGADPGKSGAGGERTPGRSDPGPTLL